MNRLIIVIAAIFLFALPPYLRTIWEASSFLTKARAATNPKEAVDYYRRAIIFRSPGNDSAYQAATELYQLAHRESEEYLKVRVEILRELRSAILSSRSILDQLPWLSAERGSVLTLLHTTEGEISALSMESSAGAGVSSGIYTENFKLQIITQIVFWGWIASVFLFIICGFTPSGEIVTGRASGLIALVALSYSAWLYCLSIG